MENMVNPDPAFWAGKRVFVTGHTGFKGSWLVLYLRQLGAQVTGYALAAPTDPAMYLVCDIGQGLANQTLGDIREGASLLQAMQQASPDIVLHLAAQPLVRYGYQQPAETYATNVMGTLNMLEAVRNVSSVRAVVNVTTDKCYENREWPWPYRENEALGGHDPYSSSKACAEILTASYRQSYFHDDRVAIATARAGNVIGGGDWANDRLLPDFLRAIDCGQPLSVRSPGAVRPWQHVLEPLTGYLLLAERLYQDGSAFAEAWNFGPAERDARPVSWIADQLCQMMPSASWCSLQLPQPHEANVLKLDSSKATSRLGWQPRWALRQALQQTLQWHQAWRRGDDMHSVSRQQIENYLRTANNEPL